MPPRIPINTLAQSSWFVSDFEKFQRKGILLDPGQAITKDVLEKHLKMFWPDLLSDIESFNPERLKQYKKSCYLSIIERDLSKKASFSENTESISILADICIQIALNSSIKILSRTMPLKFHSTLKTMELFIIAMGKLGGKELNPSSDIDIIFYAPFKNSSVDSAEEFQEKEIFWVNVVKKILRTLSQISENGFLYRVDTRLRPFGNAGPMITSFSSLQNYFVKDALDWERYAWTKFRVCNSNVLLEEKEFLKQKIKLENMVNDFLYRPFPDFNMIGALRLINRKIIYHNSDKKQTNYFSFDLKKEFGGIRSVEIIIQFFQLAKGGQHRELQTPSFFKALETIKKLGLLDKECCTHLLNGYIFLRKIEHILQYQENRQTHFFSQKVQGIDDICNKLSFKDFASLKDSLLTHIQNIKDTYQEIFSDNPTKLKKDFFFNSNKKSNDKTIKRNKFSNDKKNPYLERLYEKIKGRTPYLALLNESQDLGDKLVHLNERSSWVGDFLIQYPKLMDLLVYGNIKNKKLTMSGISEQLDIELSHIRKTNKSDIENSLNLIRDVYHRNLFVIVAQGIYKDLSITEFSDNLSTLTEAILDITFDLALRFTNLEKVDHGIGIIAFGKLGTRELDLGSDLDLIFLTKDQETAHKEETIKVIKRFISWIELRTFSGRLFKIDTALRPNGTSGLLVSSLDAFFSYQKNDAWYWEHQALTKARFLTGDKNIAEKFECIRREVIQLPKNLTSLTEEIISMRMLMTSKNQSKNHGLLADLKNSRGGLIDIEFIVQYIVLAYSSECPDLCMNKGNFFLLKLIGEKKLAPKAMVTKVANSFLKYRTLIHENRLQSLNNKLSTEIIENDMRYVVNLWNVVFTNKPKKIRPLNQIHSKIK